MYRKKIILTAIILLIINTFIQSNVFGQTNKQNYPIPPKTQNRLFYIQRNLNKNTVIYDANFDKKGNLIKEDPIDVYWIRYEEKGQRKELRYIEKKFAFGEKCEKLNPDSEFYLLKFAATDKKQLLLKQIDFYKAAVYTKINGHLSILDHIYIFADNSGIWPDVKYIELFGNDLKTGEKTYEKIINP